MANIQADSRNQDGMKITIQRHSTPNICDLCAKIPRHMRVIIKFI